MQRWSKVLLSLLATSALFGACKKPTYSEDEPLPTEYYPSIIMTSDNHVVYAVNPQTGIKNWEVALPVPPSGTPALTQFAPSPLLYNGMVYAATGTFNGPGTQPNDTLYKINAKTGKIVKKIVTNEGPFHIFASPVADANLIYLAASNGKLYAIDTGTYAVKWKYSAESGATIVASPVVANNRVYIATTTGHVIAIDKTLGPDADGNAKWDWPGQGVISTASFHSSPAVDTHYLFIGSVTDSNMYCMYVNPPVIGTPPPVVTPGLVRWTYKTKGAIYSSPTAYKGTCIFGSNDFKVYCLDTFIFPHPPINQFTPKARWVDSARSEIYASPIAVGNTVYFASKDYNLYCANIINGGVRWKFATNGMIKSSPLPYRDMVYIGSYDKVMYAVDTAAGTLKWSFPVGGQMSASPVIDDLTGKSHNTSISGYVN